MGQIFYGGPDYDDKLAPLSRAVMTALAENVFTLNSLSGFVLIAFQIVLPCALAR